MHSDNSTNTVRNVNVISARPVAMLTLQQWQVLTGEVTGLSCSLVHLLCFGCLSFIQLEKCQDYNASSLFAATQSSKQQSALSLQRRLYTTVHINYQSTMELCN